MQKIFYQTLKAYTTLALKFYFKRWQVQETTPMPPGPIIFVSNHQNAFLDAILIVCSTVRDPWFLTRANVFSNRWVKKLLHAMKMIPVYRFRDGFSTLRKNDIVIDNCVRLLSTRNSVGIFGEGNHNDQWYLRPLQKGFARIAIAAEERNNWKLGLKIVPVGIQYESHSNFRSNVLVSFGDPISVKENYRQELSAQENMDRLIQKTSEGIMPLMIHIEPDHYDNKYQFWHSHRQRRKDLVEQLKADQKVVRDYPSTEVPPAKVEKTTNPFWNPVRIYEAVNHFLPAFILKWVLKNKVKDSQFVGSVKFSLGMFVVPVFYLIQAGLCFIISQSWTITVVYFCSLPLSLLLRR